MHPVVCADPDITITHCERDDWGLVLCSDGVYDVLTNERIWGVGSDIAPVIWVSISPLNFFFLVWDFHFGV